MRKYLALVTILLSGCGSPTMDARNPDSLWSSFDRMVEKHPDIAPLLEQAIIDIRHFAVSGPGSRKLEIMGLGPSEEEKAAKSELVIQAALHGKTANDIISLAKALNEGDEAAENLLLSPVFF